MDAAAAAAAADEHAATLAELERVSERTRATLRSFWYPLVVIGALTLGAGALKSFASATVLGIYWLLGYSASFLAIGRYYAVRARRVGVAEDARPYVAFWIAFVFASFFLPTIAARIWSYNAAYVTESLIIAIGYVALARLQRSILLALVGAAIGAFGVVVGIARPAHEAAVWYFGVGAVLVLTGLYAREHDEAA
jgi:hypothetical protein